MGIDKKIKKENIVRKFKKNFKYINLFRKNLEYPEKKFLIYTRGRTGSSVLTDLLNCHPDIYCDNEIFNFLYSKTRTVFPIAYINSCSKRAGIYKKQVYGFKVKIAQLKYEHKYRNYEKILLKLHDEGWKFIYLKRLNFLRHKISNLILAETKITNIKEGEKYQSKKIKVDCDLLLKSIEFSNEVERQEEEDLKAIPHLQLVYEDDIQDNVNHQVTANKVFKYLGINEKQVRTKYMKLTPDRLEEIIQNYDEVYNFFKDTKYFEYLNY